jgi:hypothetical protein
MAAADCKPKEAEFDPICCICLFSLSIHENIIYAWILTLISSSGVSRYTGYGKDIMAKQSLPPKMRV